MRDFLLDPYIDDTVARLNAFLVTVEHQSFTEACHEAVPDQAYFADPIAATEHVSKQITHFRTDLSAALLNQALQEAFLEAGDLDYDLDALDMDRGLGRFLESRSRTGFIELFLRRYVFHSIWISIQDDIAFSLEDEPSARAATEAVEEFSSVCVAAAMTEMEATGDLEHMISSPGAAERIVVRIRSLCLADQLG